ncbi:neprilysin-like [Rhipicephalus microplus]|uniref:neprilysin-like n=1 Tax=Rhipicephalus microplus TaxID=6941 RepID=UPI003F6A5815
MFSPVAIGLLLAVISRTHGEGSVNVKDETCNDEECQRYVVQITKQMGNATPCEDFHNYVCGNWQGSKELKPKKLKTKAIADLIQILDNAPEPSKQQLNASEKLINAYKSCTKPGKQKALQNAIKGILAASGIDIWPIQENDVPILRNYKRILRRTGPRPLFSYYVSGEASSAMICMTKPKVFFVSPEFIGDYVISSRLDENVETTPDYSNYESFEKEQHEAYKKFIVSAIQLLNESFPSGELDETAEDIIKFEKKLAQFASQAPMTTTNMTLSSFINILGDAVPMDKILNKDLNAINFTVKNETIVKVDYVDYFKSVLQYLKNSSNRSTVMNYIGWAFVRDMSEAEGTELHELYLEYKNKTVVSGIDEKDKGDIKTRCMRQLLRRDVMYSAAVHVYSKIKFDNDSKEEVKKIVKNVNLTFQYVVKHNTWMSEGIKRKVQERLKKINLVMGYPDWILDEAIIDRLYQFVSYKKNPKSFVKHFFQLQENDRYQNLLKLKSTYFNKPYEGVALRSHAFYDAATDTMAYPVAALVTNFRKPPIPRSVNYATVGTVIAQLFTATMDRYDKIKYPNGTLVKNEFWDKNTTEKFCQNSQCLNNSEQCSDKEECYSDSHQKVEDYVGIRLSYKALVLSKKDYKQPLVLNDTKLDSEDKIFFTLFGSLYCPYSVNTLKVNDIEDEIKENGNFLEERADDDGDSFSKSLNEVVSIFRKFNETFSCRGNRSDTCHLVPEQPVPEPGC